jgi:hypothetical protein
MNDSQILSIAIMVVAVLAGSIFNNVRIGDLQKRIDDVSRHLGERINDTRDALRAEMAKNHSEMLHRFGDLDARLSQIEQRFMR